MPTVLAAAAGALDETMTTAIDTAFTGVKTDVLSIVGKALPVGLAIVGAVLAITLGVKFFKRISKGA